MVKLRNRTATIAVAVTVILVLCVSSTNVANAQNRMYHLEHEWAEIWIHQDGTLDLIYDVTLTLDSGQSISYIQIGQPNADFTIGSAVDQYGNTLEASDQSSGSDYKVKITFNAPLNMGNSIRFNLTTNVGGMIYNDTQNPDSLGMQFTPTWWNEASVSDLRIQIVLPAGVTTEEAKTTESAFWNNTSTQDGQLALYWEKQNLTPNQQYPVGVSFPAKYMPNYNPTSASSGLSFELLGIICIGVAFAVLGVGIAIYAMRKKPYVTPKLSMETLGIRRGLTAVEASYLLDFKPTKLVTEILYSLLQKRAVWVEAAKPALKLRIMPEFKNMKGPDEKPLRYYEIDFLTAVKADGTLDEEKLARSIMAVRDTLEQKLTGYSRKDTVEYYQKIVEKAWTQVEQAGTADVASKTYDEQLLWLMMDPNYKTRTQTTFQNRMFEPSPMWLWYWYGYTHYNLHPTYQPNVNIPTQSGQPPTIPGAEFANNIATSVENTAGNIVTNIEKFVNAIVPAPTTKTSHEPTKHGADCVCACAACACACACVSCACACAGGGVG